MTHKWKNSGYTFNDHEILRMYEQKYIPVDGAMDRKYETPLDRYKCKHCRRTADSVLVFKEYPECEFAPDSWLEKIVNFFRKP